MVLFRDLARVQRTIRFNELEINNIANLKQESGNFVLQQMVEYFDPFSVWSEGYDGDAHDIRQGPRAPSEEGLVSVCVHGSCLQ